MKANDAGGGDATSVLRDVLGADGGRERVTIRLPAELMREIRDDSKRSGATLTDAIVERLGGRPRRLASPAVAAAQTWTAVGYRLSRALEALQANDVNTARTNVADAKRLVTTELLALRDGYDADVDARESDDWSGRT